jgi:hypothetical protein
MKNKAKLEQFTVRNMGLKMLTQAIPLHPQFQLWGQKPRILASLATFGEFCGFWQVLATFPKTHTFLYSSKVNELTLIRAAILKCIEWLL